MPVNLFIIRLRVFMQIHIFTSMIRKIESRTRLFYSLNIIKSTMFGKFCIVLHVACIACILCIFASLNFV